jgi:hypothetical protein
MLKSNPVWIDHNPTFSRFSLAFPSLAFLGFAVLPHPISEMTGLLFPFDSLVVMISNHLQIIMMMHGVS